jgi:hypothetical protein
MPIPFISAALEIVGKPLGEAVKGWSDRKTAKVKLKSEIALKTTEAQIKRVVEGDGHAAGMDQGSLGQRGWKDDYLLILTTMPIVLLFVGPLWEMVFMAATYVKGDLTLAVLGGFTAMGTTPEYYWYALGMIYIDTFGFRRMLRVAIEGWAKKKFGAL